MTNRLCEHASASDQSESCGKPAIYVVGVSGHGLMQMCLSHARSHLGYEPPAVTL